MIGDIDSLHPAFRFIVDAILQEMRAKGWDAVVGSGMRSNEMQDALYAQGRQPLNVVNQMRHQVGLSPITAGDNRGVVTYARGGQSNHNRREYLFPHNRVALDVAVGYAVDIVDKRYGWNPPDHRFWDNLGELAKKHGCMWGGDWKGRKRDVAHIEMKLIDGPPLSTAVV